MLGACTLLGFSVSGCGSDDETAKTTGPQQPGPQPIELEMHVDNVPVGIEATQCRKLRIGNTGPVAIGRLVNDISNSSHHFVVSSIDEGTDEALEERPEPYDCDPFRAPLFGSPLAITQKHHDAYELPPGIGYALGPNAMIHLELHYINTTAAPVNITARTQLVPLAEGTLEHEASVMVVGTLNVNIPPNSDATTGPVFQQIESPKYDDVSIYAMTGHTHRYGTDVKVSTMESPDGERTARYDLKPFVWDAPEVVSFNPAFQVNPAGGFEYSCSWHNPTPETVTFGESATQEMCFFWVYYYPAKEGRALFLTR